MKKQIKNALHGGVIWPALIAILASGALGLAITDQKVHYAYFDLVKTVVICYFRIPRKSDNGEK